MEDEWDADVHPLGRPWDLDAERARLNLKVFVLDSKRNQRVRAWALLRECLRQRMRRVDAYTNERTEDFPEIGDDLAVALARDLRNAQPGSTPLLAVLEDLQVFPLKALPKESWGMRCYVPLGNRGWKEVLKKHHTAGTGTDWDWFARQLVGMTQRAHGALYHTEGGLGHMLFEYWSMTPFLQSGGLGSYLMSYLTLAAMANETTRAVVLSSCYLPTFQVIDSRYGFAEETRARQPGAETDHALFMYVPVLGLAGAPGTLDTPDITWVPPSLRALRRYQELRTPVASRDTLRYASHTHGNAFWGLLVRAEKCLACFSIPGATAHRTAALAGVDDAEYRAALQESPQPAPVLQIDARLDTLAADPRDAQLVGYTLALRTPHGLKARHYIESAADIARMLSDDFVKPLRKLSPLRERMGKRAQHLTMVVSNVDVRGAPFERAALVRIVAAFFVELSRELGMPLILNMRKINAPPPEVPEHPARHTRSRSAAPPPAPPPPLNLARLLNFSLDAAQVGLPDDPTGGDRLFR